MQTKIRLGILFGGQSEEHEISIRSAQGIIEHLSPEKYEMTPIGIDKKGEWHFFRHRPTLLAFQKNLLPIVKADSPHFPSLLDQEALWKAPFSPTLLRKHFDVMFPILHGPRGEDGTIQGLLELANLPYVGPGHLSSAICMDKGVMKGLLRESGLPTPKYLLQRKGEKAESKTIVKTLGLPLFVKPVQMGSSIGIRKVKTLEEVALALDEAFRHGEIAICEEAILGREIECAVLGNQAPIASLPGEIVPKHEFYSYEAKYCDPAGARLELPANLSKEKTQELQDLALKAFKALRCSGMARVDFFLSPQGTLYINELNTIPGFTPISLYPKLWEISGIPYATLLDKLIELAKHRHCGKNCFK